MTKNILTTLTLSASVIAFINTGCKKETASEPTKTNTDDLAVYKKIYGANSIARDGDYVVITVNCLPDHKSPYYQGTQWESSKYEAYNGTNSLWHQNPNKIAQHELTFRIPFKPAEASSKSATPGGPMGVSINGVPLFNQYAAMGAPLTGEINSFDQYGGHPQQQGQYHYHLEPTSLTASKGRDALMGFLLDGFPVYGPIENGKEVTNADLDAYHGHKTATSDYPEGIYHYHITSADPYINGNGFFGTPGTVSE